MTTDYPPPIEEYTEPCGCFLKIYEDGSLDEMRCKVHAEEEARRVVKYMRDTQERTNFGNQQ